MTIDAHVHLWRLSRGDNVALNPSMRAIYRDREPPDLKPLLDAAGVGRIVVVQAAETLAETLFTLGLARKFRWIAGIVAWVDPASPAIEEEVARLPGTQSSGASVRSATTTGASAGCSKHSTGTDGERSPIMT